VFNYTVAPALVSGDQLTGALSREAGENVGSYAITLGTVANANYAITLVIADFTIATLPIRVTADAKSKEHGQADPELTYTVVPDLISGDQLSGSLSRVEGEALGTYFITAGTLANSNYTINFVGAVFTILPRTNCTGSDLPATPVVADLAYCQFTTPPALTATGTSGNALFWYTASEGGSSSATAPTPDGAVAGVQTYYVGQTNLTTGCVSSRARIQVTVNAKPAKPTITPSGLGTENVLLTSSSANGNQWYRNDQVIAGATAQTYTIADKGLYTVKVTLNACQSELSDVYAIIFTDLSTKDQPVSISLFPNPAKDNLKISLTGVDAGMVSEILIFDLTGRMVGSEKMTGNEGIISLDTYTSGNYILKVSNKSMEIKRRFIKL
jgi:hypothetical protein